MKQQWDYLIITAANEAQAAAYRAQLEQRERAGSLNPVRRKLVVADPDGKRIGSGGSTLYCLAEVIRRELQARLRLGVAHPKRPAELLQGLRILILHAGGDSRRLPAYSACGKLFVPLPIEQQGELHPTLFDQLARTLFRIPAPEHSAGQIVVASGDALLLFDPENFTPAPEGVTVLGGYATPQEAERHGVYSVAAGGRLRRFFQKPSVALQQASGLLDRAGNAILDVGLMSFDAHTGGRWLEIFGYQFDGPASGWRDLQWRRIYEHGLDLYREICCAFGEETEAKNYLETTRAAGSTWKPEWLKEVFPALKATPVVVRIAPACKFLHFGSTRQLVDSSLVLLREMGQAPPPSDVFLVNTALGPAARVSGKNAWIEACRLNARLTLGGSNVLTGFDITRPLELPPGACLDVQKGHSRSGQPVCFIRCYGAGDTFKHALAAGATFCNRPLADWMETVGATLEDLWGDRAPETERTLWNARIFPATGDADYEAWLWMLQPERADARQKQAWRKADRYSAAEIAQLASQEDFHARRLRIRQEIMKARAAC